MTSLIITCTLDCDRKIKRPPGPLTLKRVCDFDEEDLDEEEWTVKNVEKIRTGSRSLIFHVQIYRPDDVPLDAVLKVDSTGEREAAYKNEVQAYQTKGRTLQNNVLPEFYGCFQAEVGATTVTCLAMEYCGERMQQALHRVDNPFVGELISSVCRLHDHGLTHGDLRECNILVSNGQPILIDLESAKSHVCGLRMKIVPGALKPTVEEFGCEELHNLVFRMGLWEPDVLRFCDIGIAKSSINSVDDIRRLIPEYASAERRETLEAKAEMLFNEVCEQRRLTYGQVKLSEIKARIDFITPEDLLAAELEDLAEEDLAES